MTSEILSRLLSNNPREAISAAQEWLQQPQLLDIEDYEVVGRGFPPIALTVGGAVSAAGAVVIASVFRERLRYIITSPQVANASSGPLKLSHDVFEKLSELLNLEKAVIPFDILEGGYAERMLAILREGSLVVNGISVELALWLGRNAGFGRILVYRPVNNKPIFRFV